MKWLNASHQPPFIPFIDPVTGRAGSDYSRMNPHFSHHRPGSNEAIALQAAIERGRVVDKQNLEVAREFDYNIPEPMPPNGPGGWDKHRRREWAHIHSHRGEMSDISRGLIMAQKERRHGIDPEEFNEFIESCVYRFWDNVPPMSDRLPPGIERWNPEEQDEWVRQNALPPPYGREAVYGPFRGQLHHR